MPTGNIILDEQSGKDFVRPGYQKILQKTKPSDTLVIKSIDRMGRNYDEILEQRRDSGAFSLGERQHCVRRLLRH